MTEPTPIRVLLIEDNPGDAFLLESLLAEASPRGFQVECAGRLGDGQARLAKGDVNLVLLDLTLPDSRGLDTFVRLNAAFPNLPIVLLTGLSDEELAIRAVHAGAQDYLVKGEVAGPLLVRALRYAIERKQAAVALARSNQRLQQLAIDLEKMADSEHQARLDLQQAHEELKRTQYQLVQSEKLRALGQLVAGVAHEINNPLAFVLTNFAVLGRDLQALEEVCRLYREGDATLSAHNPELWKCIHELVERIDLTYTLDNLKGLTIRSRDGLQRIRQITLDLREFARSAESAERSPGMDLNAGIQSTVNIIRGRARDQKVELVLELKPLPRVPGMPAKINQVVLNLVANAIDACSMGGRVTVRTCTVPGGVQFHVIDDGCGFDAAIREKIFDPFFTTKPPGQGTGLGLSISHGIVKDHHGSIDVTSEPGKGTHFTVFLPVPTWMATAERGPVPAVR
jgi:signal transduction histidine kinase